MPKTSAISQEKAIIWTVAFLFFMDTLDGTVLNTSLPQIAYSFQISPILLKVALTSYLLSLGILIPISGWIADRFGAAKVMLAAVLVFTLSSIGCGLSPNLGLLVLFRILQGLGGALMMPVGRLVVLRVFGHERLLYAMMRITILGLVGPAIGPLLGGALTTYLSWRFIFFINIPVGIVAWYFIFHYFPKTQETILRPFDALGFILFSGGLGILLYVLDVTADNFPPIWLKGLLTVLAVACITSYGIRARKIAYPMLDMAPFAEPVFKALIIGGTLTRLAMSAMPFLLPLLLQVTYGYSAFQAGVVLIFVAIGSMLNKPFMQRLVTKFGYRRILLTNTFFMLLLTFAMAILTTHLQLSLLCAFCLFYGFHSATQYASMGTLAFHHVTPENRSTANSITSTLNQVNSCFSIALSAVLLEIFLGKQDLSHLIPAVYFQWVFLVLAGFLVLAFGVFWRMRSWIS